MISSATSDQGPFPLNPFTPPASPKVSLPPLKWNERVWKVVTDAFTWLIEKICALFKTLFSAEVGHYSFSGYVEYFTGPPQELEGSKGIPNIGNSCYMNSSLQVILGTPLREYIQPDSPLKSFEAVYHPEAVPEVQISMREAAKLFREDLFKRFPGFGQGGIDRQHDAGELMEILLGSLGVSYDLKITTKSLEGDEDQSSKTEAQHLFGLPIGEAKATFQETVNRYHEPEIVDDPNNRWESRPGVYHKNYQRTGVIGTGIPDILVVQLKRMRNDLTKLDTEIRWESDEVDFGSVIDPELIVPGTSTIYTPIAYINHHGSSLGGGHYTANVKKESGWICLDDSRASHLEVQRELSDRKDAYIFVLQRK